jgi:hypothetical protein
MTLLAVLAVTTCAACGGTPQGPVQPSASNTATVRLGDIDSVVSLDATVVARPLFVIAAPTAGVVHLEQVLPGPSSSPIEVARVEDAGAITPITLPPYSDRLQWLVADGLAVTSGLPVGTASYEGFAIQATIPDAVLYRFYGTIGDMNAEINKGPGPFKCSPLGSIGSAANGQIGANSPVQTAQPTTSTSASSAPAPQQLTESGPVQLLCAPPRDLKLFDGMPALLAVTTAEAHNVLVLPVEAVAGSSQRGKVRVLLSGGRSEDRDVDLGITDGANIEIRSGLKVGDVVAVPGPFLEDGNQ